MMNTYLRNDIPTEQQFPGIYDGLDSSSSNFIESLLLERYSIGMPTTYDRLKEMVNEIRSQSLDDALLP